MVTMTCPRCGNEGNVVAHPCLHCGFQARLPRPLKNRVDHAVATPQQENALFALAQQEHLPVPQKPVQFDRQQSPDQEQANVYASIDLVTSLVSEQPISQEDAALQRPSSPETPLEPSSNEVHQMPMSALQRMTVPQQSVPSRPAHIAPKQSPDTPPPKQLIVYKPFRPVLRPHRLVPGSLLAEEQQMQNTQSRITSVRHAVRLSAGVDEEALLALQPGMLLRDSRYLLHTLVRCQQWGGGVYETIWLARDAQRQGALVTICEVGASSISSDVTSTVGAIALQTMLRNATMTLTSIGRHSHIAALWDAFDEQGRHFFVFESAGNESLLARMQRTQLTLPEPDVIACCLQMLDVLEFLAQQSPPLIHGLIGPEQIVGGGNGGHYILAGFSIVLAGGAEQFVRGTPYEKLSLYAPPGFGLGMIDGHSDLYALLATAYYTLTGYLPLSIDGSGYIPHSQRLNPHISPSFNAILEKALLPQASQRYGSLGELHQELQQANNNLELHPDAWMSGQRFEPPIYGQIAALGAPQSEQSKRHELQAQVKKRIDNSQDSQTQKPPDSLPPQEEPRPAERREWRQRIIYLATGLVMLVLIVALMFRLLF